jgi:putative ABC transport system substrate-binding protein
MDRRTFLTLASGLLAVPLASEAQPGRVYRIGATVASDIYYMAFEQGLRDAGWAPGQNPRIERRSVGGARDRVAGMVSEIVALKVVVNLATAPWTIQTFRKATSTIPIVGLDLESDPVASGFVASLAQPGGNLTGVFLDLPELSGKQLQLLKETVPGLLRVGVLWEPDVGEPQLRATEEAARAVGVSLNTLGIRRADEIMPALDRAARGRAQAMLVLTSALISNNLRQIAQLISPFTMFPSEGALMAYGPSQPAMFRLAATYVDKILRGAPVGQLPVERPSKFELVINMRIAKALNLTIPPSVRQRADQVIE